MASEPLKHEEIEALLRHWYELLDLASKGKLGPSKRAEFRKLSKRIEVNGWLTNGARNGK